MDMMTQRVYDYDHNQGRFGKLLAGKRSRGRQISEVHWVRQHEHNTEGVILSLVRRRLGRKPGMDMDSEHS